jgi:hypothetical protein
MKNEQNKKRQALQRLIEAVVDESLLTEEDVLTAAFIQPFTDIFQTAKAGLEASVASITGNVKKAAMQTAAAALPFIAASEVSRIGADESEKLKQRLAGIDDEYRDVMIRNWDTLRTRDMAGFAFLLNPTLAMGSKGALAAPALGLGVLEILSGGHPAVKELRRKASELSKKVLPPTGGQDAPSGDYAWGDMDGGDMGFGEAVDPGKKNIISEAGGFTRQQLDQRVGQIMKKLLNRKDVQQAIQKSPITQALKNSGIDAVMERVNTVSRFTSLDQFKKYMGPDFQKFEKKIETSIPQDTAPEVLKQFEDQQVIELKKSYKQFYQKYLQDMVAKNPEISDSANKALRVLDKLG